jgi:[NiFe] hydrogenase diaphorase moiety large subunit
MPSIEYSGILEEIRNANGGSLEGCQENVLPILQQIQTRFGHLSADAMQQVADALAMTPVEVEEVVSFYAFLRKNPAGKFTIRLCQTLSCDMNGKDRVARQLESELNIRFGETTPDKRFTLEYTNCMGMCDQGPAMLINDRMFTHVTPEKVHHIITECNRQFGGYPTGLVDFNPNIRKLGPILSGVSEAEAGLHRALRMSRADVIGDIREAQLRGRGGAGFPVATKWQLTAAAKGERKCVVCNADEGEPGTFKDRLLLLDFADKMMEGMTIAAYAIGAQRGLIYLRGEYAFMHDELQETIVNRRKKSLLGTSILGKEGFTFDLEIRMGAGAYVCGEETALIESMEGKRGEPRNRPPFPVNTGFFGYPTAVNNVETFVNAALILDKGPEAYKQYGTQRSTGTKLFSISGDCGRPGIYEYPLGIPISKMLEEVEGKDAKAVQIGGASGQCVPRSEFNRMISFEDAPPGGSIIVIGPHRDMLDVAENFAEFFAEESCGQCIPCRKGTQVLLNGVRLLRRGDCSLDHLARLKQLAATMKVASKCGLGQSAPNAFMGIVDHFQNELLGRKPRG